SRSGSAAPVVRDSAGVRIVENPDVEPSSGGGVAWALAEVPVLNIGALDAAPEYQFHQVRGVVRLSDGRIVVADAGSSQLRWYDSGGVHVATAGREGDGPGEFGSLAGVAVLPGDSIVTFDDRQRRLSVFDDSSTFVRSNPLAAEGHPGMEYPVFGGAMADGTLLMVGRVLQIEGMKEGPIRSPMTVYRYAPDGRMLDSLGTFHGWEALVVIREQDQFVAMAIRDRPFGRNTSVAPLPDGFVVGTPVAYEYQVHAPASVLRAIVRLERANAPVTSGDIEAYVESQLEDIEDPNAIRTRRQELSELTYPETMPAFGYPILADRGGNVWVPDFMAGDESRTWTVFDRDGRRLGSVATPADLRVFDVGDDFLLGVWRDELGVEYVRGYGLIKP
ncbi:MAG: hypothetical protein IH616_17575, partial [Gemmatimonadales bacterium]|nr:hypothetical protein [Gemmatimonadales bacterium]